MAKQRHTVQSVEHRLREIVVDHLGVDEAEVTRDATLGDDLGADSLDAVEVAMACEEEWGIEIDDGAIDQFWHSSVGDADGAAGSGTFAALLGLVEARLAAKQGVAS